MILRDFLCLFNLIDQFKLALGLFINWHMGCPWGGGGGRGPAAPPLTSPTSLSMDSSESVGKAPEYTVWTRVNH
jgi:hypothetical protein